MRRRPTQPEPHNSDAGFTLLELLVALSVFAFLLVALNRGVQTGFGVWNVQSAAVSKTSQLDAAARMLQTLLTHVPVSPATSINPGSPPVAIAFAGNTERLSLVGSLPSGFGPDRSADITLQLSADRFVLSWVPHRHELAGLTLAPSTTEILGKVRHLDFAYWGKPVPTAAPTWLAAWEGPSLPDLVRIRLGFAAGDPRRWPDLIIAPRL